MFVLLQYLGDLEGKGGDLNYFNWNDENISIYVLKFKIKLNCNVLV